MAASFVAASSQRLVNSAPPLASGGYPLTVGVWIKPSATGVTRTALAFAAAANYFDIGHDNTDQWRLIAQDGTARIALAGTVVTTGWTFLLGRWISTTNRRLDGVAPDGAVFAGNNTTSCTPAGLATVAVGCRPVSTPTSFFGGVIAEFWYAATNILGLTGALPEPLLRQLAYGGPFSIPAVAKDVLEYRTLRAHPIAGHARDIYARGDVGTPLWSNVNGVTIGEHPPLPYWYESPQQRRAPLPF